MPGPSVGAVELPADLDVVRASYDAVADNYVSMGVGALDTEPWLRAALTAFAEQVRDVGPVLDAGTGPGETTALLHALGVDVWGIDLSPRMVDHARRRHPGVRFEVASVTEVELEPASLGGVLGWWSWFNLPRPVLAGVVRRMAVALRPGGRLLLGTHAGDGDVERTTAYGDVPVRWTTHLYRRDELVGLLQDAGLDVVVDLRFAATPAQREQLLIVAVRPAP